MIFFLKIKNGLVVIVTVGSPPFVTPQGTLQVGPTHRISSFPLSSFRLPRDSNPGLAQLVPEMLPIGLKTLGPGFESLGRRKELSGNEDIL